MDLRRKIRPYLIAVGASLLAYYALGGYLLYKRGRQAGMSTDEVASHSPEARDIPALLVAADKHLAAGAIEQALIGYRRVLALDPASVKAQLGLSRGELLAGREVLAAREYERARTLDPGNMAVVLELARLYSHEPKSWGKSESEYRKYLASNYEDAEAQLELARVLAWQKKSGEAMKIFSREAVSKRMNHEDQRNYAFALAASGEDERAEQVIRKLILARPGDAELRLQLANILVARKDWNSALPIYRSLLRDKPNDPRINLNYGLGLLAMRNYRAALVPLEKARMAMPANFEAGIGFARALKGAGDLGKAVREFERVLPGYSANSSIVREYADLLLEKRDYRKSEQYYRTAMNLGLRDEALLLGLAGAMQGRGKNKEALPHLEEAYGRQPTERLALELARLYRKLGRYDRAVELLSKLEASPRRSGSRR